MKARLPQGYGGGPGNMQSKINQAQKVQEDNSRVQEEMAEREFTASVGGGAVEITVTGNHQVRDIKIKPEVVDPEDIDMLSELIIAAANEAMRQADEVTEAEMSKASGGLNIPGLF